MTAPSLTLYAQGQGTVNADGLNTFEQTCNTAADLYAFIGTVGMQVYLRGIDDVNDGGAGVFYWNVNGTADDGVNNILPNGSALGCWTRITATIGSGVIITSGSSFTLSNAVETVVVDKTTGSATTIFLPPSPVEWQTHIIKDGKGDASSNNITVNGNGNTIDGSSTQVINTDYGSQTFQFDGVEWGLVGGGATGSVGPPGPPGPSLSLPGIFTGLKIVNNTGTPNTKADITARSITLGSGSASVNLTGVSVTVNTAVNGANGLDTGSIAASTWYALYVIYNSSTATVAGLISLSTTTPTLPSGYAYYARVGRMRTDGSTNLLRTLQYGRWARYTAPPLPLMDSGVKGNITTPTWSAIAVANFVPDTASEITLYGMTFDNNHEVIIAPNNSYGGFGNLTATPPVTINNPNAGGQQTEFATLMLESTNIYWASNGADNAVFAYGWTDNL